MEDSLLYLHTPSNSIINPPIDATSDTLPIEKLTWEDFEKLCLRIAQIQHGIDDCEIYGIKGEKQNGIDIYGRNKNEKYTSYQCKKYISVTKNTLTQAVKKFTEEDWYTKSDTFIFCTTFSFNKVQLQDHFESLKNSLSKQGIKFIKWDKIQICQILKENPKIVFDFFGKEWVKNFNGIEKLNLIPTQYKLDANEVSKFRKELYLFYNIVFNNHDSGISIQETKSQSFPLQERFIMPDTLENNDSNIIIWENENIELSKKEQYQRILEEQLPDSYNTNTVLKDFVRKQEKTIEKHSKHRVKIDTALIKNKKSIILGDPGSGKSTLLRNLVLDILSVSPKFKSTTLYWGNYLPIWMPFAFVTKNLTSNNNLSITDLLLIWFDSHDKGHLFSLIKDALSDERLLLVIDGVDELTNKSSAQLAISKIEIHSDIANTSILYSSRPSGYKFLQDSFPKICELYLLPFSEVQQQEFIHYWYEKWLISINNNDLEYAKTQTLNFYKDLEKSLELKHLAENPLLLSILISQRLRDSILPNNKFKALETITEHLINIHPKKRKASANIDETEIFNFDLIEIFEELAIYIQKNINDGIIEKSEAKEIITNYLTRLMGYKIPEAKLYSEQIFNIGANHYGIIIEKSSHEIAFTHRLFQEFLAARYMYNTEDEAEQILSKNGGNPSWHQVLKLFFAQIPPRKTSEFKKYVELIGIQNFSEDYINAIPLLKYDVVLTLNNSPIDLAKDYFQKITNHFDYEVNPELKKNYWTIILNSLYNSKIKNEVKNHLFNYFPNYYKYDDYRISPLKKITNLTEFQKKFLIKTLINGNRYQRLDVSYIIQKNINDGWLYTNIIELLDLKFNPEIAPYALNCLISDYISIDVKKLFIEKFKDTIHLELLIFVYKTKVHLKEHSVKDLIPFLELQKNINFHLRDEITRILITGWPKSKLLLKKSLNSLDRNNYNYTLESEIAWKVLFECFHKEESVLKEIINELENNEFPFLGTDVKGFDYLLNYYKDNEKLIPIIDKWIIKQEHNEPQIGYASLIGRTDKIKKHLLKFLKKANFPHWITMALLEGWGEEKEVISSLKKYFSGNYIDKNYSAHFIGDVFKDDKNKGIEILEKIIFDRKSNFRDRAIKGMITLDKDYFKENILEKFLEEEFEHVPSHYSEAPTEILYTIIENFNDEKTNALVFQKLKKNKNDLHLIINFYANNLDIIDKYLKISQPLEKSLRLELIEKLTDQGIYDSDIKKQLEYFSEETDEIIQSTASLAYFNELKHSDPEKIISICKKNIFQRGFNYEVQRQIAFCGYLIAKKLPEYFSIKEEETLTIANPGFTFETSYNKISESIIKLLIDNFEYLNSVISGDFKKITQRYSTDMQKHWGFLARYSNNISQTYSHIIDYLKTNETNITDIQLIDFLNRTSPNNSILKNICFRLITTNESNEVSYFVAQIIGKNFNNDKVLFQHLNDDIGNHPKLLALCIGWPEAPILKIAFEQLKNKEYLNRHLAYNLKFLFSTLDEMKNFLTIVFENYTKAQKHQQFFIKPLLKRVHRDPALQEYLKIFFLNSESASVKISFFELLNSTNKIDNEILNLKEFTRENNSLEKYGYNILTNELVLLSSLNFIV